MVNGVVRGSNDGTLGKSLAFDGHAAGENLTGENATDRRGETHGFVDAGAEVSA